MKVHRQSDSLQRLVDELSQAMQRSVLVDDGALRLLAYSPCRSSDDQVRRTAILARATAHEVREAHRAHGIATADGPLRTPACPALALEARVCVPMRVDDALLGYLWVIDADESLNAQAYSLLSDAARRIGAALQPRHERIAKRRRRGSDLLAAVLDGDLGATRGLVAAGCLSRDRDAVALAVESGDALDDVLAMLRRDTSSAPCATTTQ